MGILKRVAGFLGFIKEETREEKDDETEDSANPYDPANNEVVHLHRKGFGVRVQAVVDRSPIVPVLIPCSSGDGGLQGLQWHAKRLRVDEDGDVADEFLCQKMQRGDDGNSFPMFESNFSSRAAKVRCQTMSKDGKIQHCIERHQGGFMLV